MLDGETVYSAVDEKPKRSRKLKRLENIRARPAVSLLVDRFDDDWSKLWWIVAEGQAQILEPEGEAGKRFSFSLPNTRSTRPPAHRER